MLKPFMVAVAGGTGSGKTTFVGRLLQHLSDLDPLVIQLDHYYRDRSHLDHEAREAVNYDHPDAIEMPLLMQHLALLAEGKGFDRPVYDFPSHTRKKEVLHLEPKRVVIIDGIFTLCEPRLFPLFDLKIFIDADTDIRLARRIKRDLATRGRTVDLTIDQYLRTVKPMHEQFIEPTKRTADMIIPWVHYNESGAQHVAEIIRHATK